jgi:hypothetical protein
VSPPQQPSARPRGRWRLFLLAALAIGGAVLFQLSARERPAPTPAAAPAPTGLRATADSEVWERMARGEEFIARIDLELEKLAFAAQNLELPDDRTRDQFWPVGLRIADIGPAPAPAAPLHTGHWPVGETVSDVSAADLRLWRPLLERVQYFQWTKLRVKKGDFAADDPESFDGAVHFTGLARMQDGNWSWIRARQKVRWKRVGGPASDATPELWRIRSWITEELVATEAPDLLFREVAELTLPDAGERERARLSLHERAVAKVLLSIRAGVQPEFPDPYFTHVSNDRHPGISVVDIDADGFDDLYVMERSGRNLLLRNRGDGSFEDVAPELGVDVDGHSSSAIFADFDNDGDPDLFVGRTIEASVYLENVGGRFVDRSAERVDGWMPRLVSSVSAVDYDGDGLLDVYVSTYAATMLWSHDVLPFMAPDKADRFQAMFPRETAGEWAYFDMLGPPNVMLRNTGGGRFEVVEDPVLESFRNTYQATWADFDADGDPDVYLANDFADDQVLRNEGGGRFVEATKELGFDQFALGMGASWGDYDRDGRQDVYVSNMYSTAGSRITEKLAYLDPRFQQSAQGNFLWRNEGERFRKVSGDGGILSERTGWSWGSQLTDLDNDGFLDVVVLNGFYTAPREVALAGDT